MTKTELLVRENHRELYPPTVLPKHHADGTITAEPRIGLDDLMLTIEKHGSDCVLECGCWLVDDEYEVLLEAVKGQPQFRARAKDRRRRA